MNHIKTLAIEQHMDMAFDQQFVESNKKTSSIHRRVGTWLLMLADCWPLPNLSCRISSMVLHLQMMVLVQCVQMIWHLEQVHSTTQLIWMVKLRSHLKLVQVIGVEQR